VENDRLRDQAGVLADLLHADIFYSPGGRVLEAGCGGPAFLIARSNRNRLITCSSAFFWSICPGRWKR
jgi:hypothetical protein